MRCCSLELLSWISCESPTAPTLKVSLTSWLLRAPFCPSGLWRVSMIFFFSASLFFFWTTLIFCLFLLSASLASIRRPTSSKSFYIWFLYVPGDTALMSAPCFAALLAAVPSPVCGFDYTSASSTFSSSWFINRTLCFGGNVDPLLYNYDHFAVVRTRCIMSAFAGFKRFFWSMGAPRKLSVAVWAAWKSSIPPVSLSPAAPLISISPVLPPWIIPKSFSLSAAVFF